MTRRYKLTLSENVETWDAAYGLDIEIDDCELSGQYWEGENIVIFLRTKKEFSIEELSTLIPNKYSILDLSVSDVEPSTPSDDYISQLG